MPGTLQDARLEVGIPFGWFAMPDPTSSDAAGWPAALARDLDFGGADAAGLAASLTAAVALARSQDRPRRRSFVFLGDPAATAVQSWAQLDLVPRDEPVVSAAITAWETAAREIRDGAVWNREVKRAEVHGDPAVIVHDLLVTRQPGGQDVLQHRAVLTVFPQQPVLIELTLSTPYLGVLPGLAATALHWAETIRIEVPE